MDKHISVKGSVQGVGFAPFVHGLASRLQLRGWMCHTSGGAEILVQGQESNIDCFIRSLTVEAPSLAKIHSMAVSDVIPACEYSTFDIRPSQPVPGTDGLIDLDMAICPDCERELFDPRERRYLYPFLHCASCGPRFSILRDLPYRRQTTTMSGFAMCGHCQMQFSNPQDRHFQAQAIACPECGPFIELRETHSQFPTSEHRVSSFEIHTSAILKARRLLREGYIIAIKGLGGFHLVCDALNPYSVAELRERKGRSDKPFAVMAASFTIVSSICEVSRAEHLLLSGRERPIVLLHKRPQAGIPSLRVSELVAPNLDTLGVMLPDTALHHLLLNQTDPLLGREPVPPILVMTSSNFSEEPIATENKETLQELSALADAFLLHNRDIHIRLDDSVVKLVDQEVIHVRRARSYAPYSIRLPFESRPTLALGGERRNAFCLTRDRYAYMSHHIGDTGNQKTWHAFEQSVAHLSHLLHLQAGMVVHDLKPTAFAAQFADRAGLPHVGVQHHHAHIASCMVDNGLENTQVIGLAFDGAGWGTDHALWGGECLLVSYHGFERFAHLEYLPSPERNSDLMSPWRLAVAYAQALGICTEDLPFLQNIDRRALAALQQQVGHGERMQAASSMGYLFDAVASLIGVRNEVTYEAQAAMEMETLSRPFLATALPYPYTIEQTENGLLVRLKELLSAVVDAIRAGQAIGLMGARFHRTVANIAIDMCERARMCKGVNEVALSGGVWQNEILFSLVRHGLEQAGFQVYVHRQVPPNDGGLALGQAVIANCMD